MTKPLLIATLVAAAALAACGGGDDTPAPVPPATTQVPPSASQSVGGFIAYLQELVASVASLTDTLEPVDTSSVLAPVDDVGEPTKVD